MCIYYILYLLCICCCKLVAQPWSFPDKVDMVVCGAGTGGTVAGIGRKLKEKVPDCKVRSTCTLYMCKYSVYYVMYVSYVRSVQ